MLHSQLTKVKHTGIRKRSSCCPMISERTELLPPVRLPAHPDAEYKHYEATKRARARKVSRAEPETADLRQ